MDPAVLISAFGNRLRNGFLNPCARAMVRRTGSARRGGSSTCVRISRVFEGTKIVLASTSPRRRELMGLGNWTFTVSASDVDESERPGEPPADYVLRLAEDKA